MEYRWRQRELATRRFARFWLLGRESEWSGYLRSGKPEPRSDECKAVCWEGPGNLVFILDFLKGLAAAGWPLIAYSKSLSLEYYALIGLFGGIIGHSFSVFTRFRGGKGVATMLGGVLL